MEPLKVLVVSISCRGVMGLAAASFSNAVAANNETLLLCGEKFPSHEIRKTSNILSYPIDGQGIKELVKVWLYHSIIKDIVKFSPDVIVFFSSHLHNLILLRWAVKHKIKTVFMFHDPDERTQYPFLSKQYIFDKTMNWHNKLMIKYVTKVLVTYSDATFLVQEKYKITDDKVAVIPLIPLTELATREQYPECIEKKFDIVFYGRVDKYKDYETFFKAVDSIFAKGNEVSILLIIQGNIDITKKYCSCSWYPSLTVINDFLPEREFEALVSSAKVAVFPYSGATGSHGPSVAFSLGVPIIATDVGCFQEYINDFGIGICVEPKNPLALALAIMEILETTIPKALIQKKFKDGLYKAKQKLYEVMKPSAL